MASGCVADTNCGTNIAFFNSELKDNVWHQYYIAWRQGESSLEICTMRDDTNPLNCGWSATDKALGAQLDGVLLSGITLRSDLGDRIWYDELQAVQQ